VTADKSLLALSLKNHSSPLKNIEYLSKTYENVTLARTADDTVAVLVYVSAFSLYFYRVIFDV